MEFLNPALLWALPFGAVPIIIYYLMRFRALNVTWGADYVLQRALARLKKEFPLEQFLLLAARVLAGLLLVIAFSRLVSTEKGQTTTKLHRVILVDVSASMAAEDSNGEVWQRTRGVLEELIGTWSRGIRWSLVTVGKEPGWVVRDQRIDTPEAAIEQLRTVQPGTGKADLPLAIETITRELGGGELELYIAADDQALTWEGMDQVRWPDPMPSVYWVAPPLESRSNQAITRVRPGSDVVLAEHPSRVFIGIRNFGLSPVEQLPVELLVDGIHVRRENVSLLAGQEGTIAVDLQLEDPGSHKLSARLAKDVLAVDDRLGTGVEVREPLRLAVLRAPGQEDPWRSAGPMLEVLERSQKAKDRRGRQLLDMGALEIEIVTPDDAEALDEADVLLVDGGIAATPELGRQLQDALHAGKGLILAPDTNSNPERWNRHYSELLPAHLGAQQVNALDSEIYQTLSPARFRESALQSFVDAEDGNLAESRFFCWYELGPVRPGTLVLARFEENLPYVVEDRGAPGSVLLLAAGLNSYRNNMMVREFTIPFVIRLASQAASGTVMSRTVGFGDPIRMVVKDPVSARSITFHSAGAPPLPVAPVQRNGLQVVEVPHAPEQNEVCSLLVVRADGERERAWYGVQGPWADSDLAPLSEELERSLTDEEGAGIRRVPDWEQLDELLQETRRGTEYYTYCVAGLLLLLFAEMVLARRFV